MSRLRPPRDTAPAGRLPLLLALCAALAACAPVAEGPAVDDAASPIGDAAPDAMRPPTPVDASPDGFGPIPDAIWDGTDDPPDAIDMAPEPPDAIVLPMADAMIIPRPDAGIEGPPPYPADRDHSPLTPWIADRLRAIADRAPRAADVFAKVGDSVTVSRAFLGCFATDDIQLDGRDDLWPTLEHFRAGDAAGTDPFRRVSQAATVGWSAWHAQRGDPSPLDAELALLDPRFAVVMYGTNDIQSRDIDAYALHMWDLVDAIIDRGVIPILSTIMPRDDDPDADAEVPRYNAVVRALAQGRGVPLVDFHRTLAPLPDHGLGPDRLHPSVSPTGPCDLSPDGLAYGYNLRNLLTLTALDRARQALDGPAPDPPVMRTDARGTVDDPIVIEALPFTDLRDTRDAPGDDLDAYPGCDAPQDESGPEVVYALTLDRPTIVRARLYDRGAVDIDLHLLSDAGVPAACLDRDHRTIEASLGVGTWYFVLDTFVDDGGIERSGEYLFTLIAD